MGSEMCIRDSLNGEGPLPPPAATLTTARRQGPPVGRRARGTRTTILACVQKTLHLGALLLATQDGESEYARDERSGLSPLPVALQLCRGAYSSPRPVRSALSQHAVILPALRFASHSIAPQTASACPRAGIRESYWKRRNNPRHTAIKTE